MPRVGVVLETMGSQARLSTSLRGVCEGCGDKSSCSMGGDQDAGPSEVVLVDNPIRAGVGDHVSFDLSGHAELGVSLLVWGIPALGLLLGAVGGAAAAEPLGLVTDTGALIGASSCLVLSALVMVVADRLARGDARLVPKILAVVEPCVAVEISEQERSQWG